MKKELDNEKKEGKFFFGSLRTKGLKIPINIMNCVKKSKSY